MHLILRLGMSKYIETKTNEGFDDSILFDIEAKQTCLILQFSIKTKRICLFNEFKISKRSEFYLILIVNLSKRSERVSMDEANLLY